MSLGPHKKMHKIVSAACLALALPAPMLAQANGDAPAPMLAEPTAKAMAAAEALLPRSAIIEANVAGFGAGFSVMARQNPSLQQILDAHPGLEAALIASGSDETRKVMEAEYPGLLKIAARFIDARYTPAEQAALIGFYSSSAGQKMLRNEIGSSDPETMLEAFTDEDGKLTDDEANAMSKTLTPARLAKSLTPAERVAASKFFASPAGRKIGANSGAFQSLSVNWVNDVIARNGSRFAERSGETMAAFMADAAAKKKAAAQQ